METRDATVDGWTLLSSMSEIEVLPQARTILTSLEIWPAKISLEAPKSLDTLMFRAVTTWLTPSKADLFPSPLMPQSGVNTKVELLALAVKPSTTESCWSVSLTAHGESRTHGDKAGEKVDMSDFKEETPVLSVDTDPILPSDQSAL